ncbi:cytochrome P450 [Gigaspora rosea]|uniref:Cytochrome P450 n=1 Tax=Gigaspora rosea TaxID=44941 RepID=A0A397UJ60_9GLOM|nr:cytochrome P450 [Gigaspora rosea]
MNLSHYFNPFKMSLYLIAFAAFLVFICYHFIYHLYLSPLCKIPGPPVKNLLLGHFASFLNEEPGESLNNIIKENGDFVRGHAFLCKPFLLITNLKLIQQIFIDNVYDYGKPKMVIIRDVTGKSLPFVHGAEHQKQRKMMEPMFFVSNLKAMFPTILKSTHQLKDIWLKKIGNKKEERIRISDDFSRLTLDMIGLIGFDLNFNSINSPSKLAKSYAILSESDLSPLYVALIDIFPFIRKIPFSFNVKYYNALGDINDISAKIFDKIKNNPTHKKTFISLLLQANEKLQDNEKLSDHDLLNQVSLKYLDSFYRETLRVVPPLPIHFRIPEKDVNLNGYTVPKGTPLMISAYAIHRNPLIWGESVENFDPSRWLNPEIRSRITKNAYLPFIIGPRTCIGMKLAQIQFKAIMLILIKNFEFKLVKGFTFKKTTATITKPIPGIDLMVSKVN